MDISFYDFNEEEKLCMAQLVASCLWEHLEQPIRENLDAFLEGIKEAEEALVALSSYKQFKRHIEDALFCVEQKWKAKQALKKRLMHFLRLLLNDRSANRLFLKSFTTKL
ncbi:hypothetical protein [Parachlamydia acanthamoebae]|nr:hypothetical protein [Parachlamydia acanthamoebae]KIA77131.1 hypothetical protein DB43_GU00240 [Parachlamydia acanthamoebae]